MSEQYSVELKCQLKESAERERELEERLAKTEAELQAAREQLEVYKKERGDVTALPKALNSHGKEDVVSS